MDSWSEETNSPSEDVSFYLSWLNRTQKGDWDCYSVLLSLSGHRSALPCGRPLTLYSSLWTILVLHLLIIHAYTWVHVPLAVPSNVLWVAVTQIALFKSHVHINGVRVLVVGIQCGGVSLSWNCPSTIFSWLSYCTCAFPWDALGDCPWWRAIFFFHDLSLPRTRLSLVTSAGSLDPLRSSSDISSTSAWALSLIWNGSGLPKSPAPQ